MNIQQLDRLFAEVAQKHPVKTYVVMGSLTVLGLINDRQIPDAMPRFRYAGANRESASIAWR